LIIAELQAGFHSQARRIFRLPGIYNEEKVAGWRRVTGNAVHAAGRAHFCQVMASGGGMSHPQQPARRRPPDRTVKPTGRFLNVLTSGFKACRNGSTEGARKQMNFYPTRAQFARAGRTGRIKGGWLPTVLSSTAPTRLPAEQFMKKGSTNCRTDDYGGSEEECGRQVQMRGRGRRPQDVSSGRRVWAAACCFCTPVGEINSPVGGEEAVFIEMAAQAHDRRPEIALSTRDWSRRSRCLRTKPMAVADRLSSMPRERFFVLVRMAVPHLGRGRAGLSTLRGAAGSAAGKGRCSFFFCTPSGRPFHRQP